MQGRVFRNLLQLQFIERKLTVNVETNNTSKSHPKFEHSITSLLPTLPYDYHLRVFVDRNFLIQHSFNLP